MEKNNFDIIYTSSKTSIDEQLILHRLNISIYDFKTEQFYVIIMNNKELKEFDSSLHINDIKGTSTSLINKLINDRWEYKTKINVDNIREWVHDINYNINTANYIRDIKLKQII